MQKLGPSPRRRAVAGGGNAKDGSAMRALPLYLPLSQAVIRRAASRIAASSPA
jgi:hypothetical protein